MEGPRSDHRLQALPWPFLFFPSGLEILLQHQYVLSENHITGYPGSGHRFLRRVSFLPEKSPVDGLRFGQRQVVHPKHRGMRTRDFHVASREVSLKLNSPQSSAFLQNRGHSLDIVGPWSKLHCRLQTHVI